jgi:hypothetical protein
MAKQNDPPSATGADTLKTGGEAAARGYAAADVPAATLCPTMEMDKVRILPPTQTPTVKLGDLANPTGPRDPDAKTKPKPKPPVELPEGRPTTAMQVIEIDPELLVELTRRQAEREAHDAATPGHDAPWVQETGTTTTADPPTASTPAAPNHAAATARPTKTIFGMAILAVALLVAVVAVTRTREPRGPQNVTPAAKTSTIATASAAPTAIPSTTAAPTATTAPLATASASAGPRAPAPVATARARAAATRDPYDEVTAPASTASPAPMPSPAKTATTAPTAGSRPEF